ncbi:MAG: gluconokinase [Nitrososphaeria archaeon]
MLEMVLNKDILLGVDIGTTAVRAFTFDTRGNMVKQSKIEVGVEYPRPSWAEQDPDGIYSSTVKAVRAVAKHVRGCVKAIGFSGQMHGLCCVDEDGEPLTKLIPWVDVRAGEQAEELEKLLGAKELYRRTGCPPLLVYIAPKILWAKKNQPNTFAECKKMLTAQDYVVFKLFREYYTNPSLASGSQLLNISSIKWDERLLEAVGISEEYLPTLVEGDKVFDRLPSHAAEELGLEEGVPIALGASDGALSNIGLNAVREGVCAVNLGSSGAVRVVSTEPIWDEDMRFFCYYIASKRWLCGGAVNNCGIVLRWYRDNFADKERERAAEEGVDVYKLLDEEAEKAPVGCDGLMFLPFMSGERFPVRDPYVRGMVFGLSLVHGKGHVIRSMMEGITYTMEWIGDALGEHKKIDLIKVSGGGARSNLWRQITSDVFEKRVVRTSVEEASALGAVILAGVAIGEYKSIEEAAGELVVDEEMHAPRPESIKVYRRTFEIFKEAYRSSRAYCDKLLRIKL